MANVLFISETFLKDNTLLHENIDFKYLRPVVLMCQDIHIQHKLGTTLYDELKTQITNSTLTAANLTLLENYIQPSLLYWVQAEAPTAISYKFLNKGLHQHQVLRTVQTLHLTRLTSFSIGTRIRRSGTRNDWLISCSKKAPITQRMQIQIADLIQSNLTPEHIQLDCS
jgi:hypothetical protein